MRHIFTVHSPITFLCAYSVCRELNLAETDVIIISSNYQPPFEYGQIVIPYHEEKKGLISKLREFNLPRSYDKFIDKLTDEVQFVAYIDLMHYWQRMLVTHERCKGFNFLEEGMNSYLKPDTLAEVTFVAKDRKFRIESFKEYVISLYFALRSYNHRLLNLPYWAYGYKFLNEVNYYCFSDLCYPGVDDKYKKVVPFRGHSENGIMLENVVIWIEDIYNKRHVPEQKWINEALYKAAAFIERKFGKSHKHLIKLRPNGKIAESEVASILTQQNISYDTLEILEPLELILKRSRNIVLVSATSSLLFYGKLMGHEAYTYFWLLKNRRHSSFEGMNFYWTTIHKIPENQV